jgi:hypothetical protein
VGTGRRKVEREDEHLFHLRKNIKEYLNKCRVMLKDEGIIPKLRA